MGLLTRIMATVILIDQATKLLIVHALNLRSVGVIEVLPPWLTFRMAWNRGVNFGLFAGDADVVRWGLIALALAVSFWVWLWARRERTNRKVQAAAGLLIGGALGNVLDRVIYGAVADFLNMTCCGLDNPYAFNIADVAIFAGAIGLILWTGPGKDPVTRRK